MADKKEVSKILSNVKAMVSDTIPKQSQMHQADMDAINGKRKNQSPTQERLDSIASKFNRNAWVKQVNDAGMDVMSKNKKK